MKKFLLVSALFLVGCSSFEQSADVQEKTNVEISSTSASVVDNFDYVNKRFSFALNILEGFSSKILSDDAGILLEKTFPWNIEHSKDDPKDYKLEIVILPFENIEKFADISEFVASKYAGFSVEFADYPNLSGVYVDEGVGKNNAIRHFFSLSKNEDFVYEIYMKLPPIYYDEHKQFFADLVQRIKIF